MTIMDRVDGLFRVMIGLFAIACKKIEDYLKS